MARGGRALEAHCDIMPIRSAVAPWQQAAGLGGLCERIRAVGDSGGRMRSRPSGLRNLLGVGPHLLGEGLVETFGEAYQRYRRCVPAFLPYKGAAGGRYRELTAEQESRQVTPEG